MIPFPLHSLGVECVAELLSVSDGCYNIVLEFIPGLDESYFDKLKVPGCDISINGKPFARDCVPIQVTVPPEIRKEAPEPISFTIRPRTKLDRVKIIATGDWLTYTSCRKYLS